MFKRFSRRSAFLAMFACGLLMSGCSTKSKSDKAITRKGQVKSIDMANRIVHVTIVGKSGKELDIPGTYTDETVVRINGRNASVKDVQEGDKVEVTGRKEGNGTDATFIATRVIVTRNQGDWQSTGKNAKPAADDKSTAKADTDQ